ncbi:SusE domain-containing protein [Sediminitomix flava]|uniref:SusE-like outer membrane protein n=1 Tax=Sediminitomix flava TaxID=379075 RepID=A0A315ZB10_SEDFL|nr:SusE domain-containing protein [Sediminitomix flava]PWJ42482.1 SusE-like outer membrane protein [Sediminitomix flava]
MKTNFVKYILFFLASFAFVSCQEDDQVKFTEDTATVPVLTNPEFESLYNLDKAQADDVFKTFTWTATKTDFPSKIVYALELISEEGLSTVIEETASLTSEVTIGELNSALGAVEADTLTAANYEFRVVSKLANDSGNSTGVGLASESFNTSIKPYASHYKLFVVAASEGGKVVDSERYIISSAADHEYAGAVELLATETYEFYTNDFNDGSAIVYGVVDGAFVEGGDALVLEEDGKYNFTASLNDDQAVSFVKAQPILWVPGAHNGWSHDIVEPVEGDIQSYTNVNLVSVQNNGVYTGKVWLTSEFKFSAQAGWDGTNYGAGSSKGQLDTDPGAGNHNAADFEGPGLYELEVNTNSNIFKVLSVEKLPIEVPEENALWIVGDQSAWGLNVNDIILETKEGSGIYEGVVDLVGAFDLRTTQDGIKVDKTYRSPVITEGQVSGNVEENATYTFRVPKKDKYLLKVDLNEGTYELGEAINYVYKVGDANGWNNPDDANYFEIKIPEIYVRGSKVYETTLTMTPGEGFKIVGVPGSWADSDGNWGFDNFPSNSSLINNDGGNFKFVGEEAKEYKVTLDFNNNTMAFGERIYKVGSANGWNDTANSNRQRAEWVSDQVYVLETALVANEEFKFVGILGSWDDGNYGWGDVENTTSELLQDKDGNIQFVGTDGTYKLTIDLASKSIEIEAAQ